METISKRKRLFELPLKEDELEYWGPLNHEFCNSFLTMGNVFFDKFFKDVDVKTIKTVFSAFVELVQNAAEYNVNHYQNNLPQSYINLKVRENFIQIYTVNQIEEKDVIALKERFEQLNKWSPEELDKNYKEALIKGKSLGLIMIKRMKNANLDWEIAERNDKKWLAVELKINYGKA